MSNRAAFPQVAENRGLKLVELRVALANDGTVDTTKGTLGILRGADLATVALSETGRYTFTLKNKYASTPVIKPSIQPQTGTTAPNVTAQPGTYTAHTASAYGTVDVMTLSSALAKAACTFAAYLNVDITFRDTVSDAGDH